MSISFKNKENVFGQLGENYEFSSFFSVIPTTLVHSKRIGSLLSNLLLTPPPALFYHPSPTFVRETPCVR